MQPIISLGRDPYEHVGAVRDFSGGTQRDLYGVSVALVLQR